MEKEVSEVERKRSVKRKYVDSINLLLSKNIIGQQELYSVVRGFFSELLKLDYEFTYEELSSDLNKIFLKSALKTEIDDFLYDLSESEYFLEKELEPEQVREFVVQFQGIVKSMIYDSEVKDYKPSFFEKLFGYNKSMAVPSETTLSSSEDATSTNTADTVNTNANNSTFSQDVTSKPPMQSISPNISVDDRQEVRNENEWFKQKLFKDQGTAEISSSNQDTNILLTFDGAENETDDAPKSEIIKSGANMISEAKESKKRIEKSARKEQKESNRSKPEESDTSTIEDDSRSPYLPKKRLDINKKIMKDNSLLVEDNSPDMVGIHEFMEESYLHMNNSHIDDAKRSYLKALDIYHKLTLSDKKIVYDDLYMLFKKLRPL